MKSSDACVLSPSDAAEMCNNVSTVPDRPLANYCRVFCCDKREGT